MKKYLAKVVTISCLFLFVSLFVLSFFYKSKSNNDLICVIDNNNFDKMDDNILILFEKKELPDDSKVDLVIEEPNGEEQVDEEQVIEEIVPVQKVVEEVNEVIQEPSVEEKTKEEINEESDEPVRTSLIEEREVLQTVVGNLTGYGPDCVGCGGHTSTGFDLTKSIYYEDSEFGTVRILAADPSFPFYSIFRVSNVPTMDDFIGIVLDRGGNVGFGRGTLFDLAFESEESSNLVPLTRNVKFEMLRSGK